LNHLTVPFAIFLSPLFWLIKEPSLFLDERSSREKDSSASLLLKTV
jgi:hypothetical protein